MLQIIGWMGCLYLIIKAFELYSSSANRVEDGTLRPSAVFGIWIAVVGSVAFFALLSAQGSAFAQNNDLAKLQAETAEAQRVADCMEAAPDLDAMLAC